MMKMMFLSTIEMNKMVNIQNNLEKSIDSVFEHLKRYPEYDAFEYLFEVNTKRQLESEELQLKINGILGPLASKIKLLKDDKLSDITDFKRFKKEMIDIQENIQNLRCETKTKTELLETEIIAISEDILFYNEKLLEWAEPVKINTSSNFFKTKTIRAHHKCKEVKEFMDFLLKTGGRENGWRKEDHQLFLKLRSKNKNIDVAKTLHDQLPDISIEEIKKHEEWYNKYLSLQKKKKEAIKFWQNNKAINKNKTVSRCYSSVPSKIKNVLEQPDENIQERLLKWKAEREDKLKAARELEICQEQKKKKIDFLKKRQQEEVKKVVQEWKESRQLIEQQEILLKRMEEEYEKKRRAAEANKMIKQFQTQDDMYISKMRQQKKKEVTPQSRSQSSHLAKRDPERLLKPTIQWINRVHDENHYSNKFSAVMDLKSLPKLSIPEWRKQLVD